MDHTLKNVHGQVRILKLPGKIPESGSSGDEGASAAPAPPQSKETGASATPASTKARKKNQTSDAADNDTTGKARFYTEEIKEKFPILYAWLSTMDILPHLSDDNDSDEDKSEFRYGIRYNPDTDSSEDDKHSLKKSLNDLD